jgi:sugar O-acyltransferase (sialic acid O-acetyltransferase NeuD family)
MKTIILLGAGGHCKSCIDVIEKENKYKILYILDKINKNKKLFNYKISSENLLKKKKNLFAFVTVGQIKNYRIRQKLFKKLLSLNFKIPSIISPLSYVSPKASIGSGTIIMHGVIINADVRIGKNCIINTNSVIEHGVKIKDHTHISTGAIINGETIIGSKVFIGSGSVVTNNIKVDDCCIVGSGINIKKNLKKNSIVK